MSVEPVGWQSDVPEEDSYSTGGRTQAPAQENALSGRMSEDVRKSARAANTPAPSVCSSVRLVSVLLSTRLSMQKGIGIDCW